MSEKDDGGRFDQVAVCAARGDQVAFAELYQYYFPRVYNFIFAKVKNVDLADDIVSDVFIKIYRKLDSYDPGKAAFSTWLFRAAANSCTDALRTLSRKRESSWEAFFDPAAPTSEEPEARALVAEQNSELLKAMDKLSERERRLVELKYWSGLGNVEIAELTGLNVSNVGTILFRALGKLKQILGDRDGSSLK